MMPPILQARFEQLMLFATDPKLFLKARENLACARELANTLIHTGHLSPAEYQEWHSIIDAASVTVATEERQRAEKVKK